MSSVQRILLGDLAQVKGGKRLPKGEKLTDAKTAHPYIRVKDFHERSVDVENIKYIPDQIQSKISRYVISISDVYISIAGTIGLVGTIPECLDGANLTENAAKITIDDPSRLDREYLVWYLATAGQASIQAKMKATSQPKLALFRIEEMEIPLPPLPEQRRIAAILDKADELRQKRRQAIEKLDQLLQSVFLDMFGDPVTNPKGWDVKPVEEIVRDFVGGKNVQSAEVGDPFTHRILKVSAVTKKIYDASESKPLPIDSKIDPRAYVGRGDLLISRANTAELVGATAYVWDTPKNIVLPDKVWKFDFRAEAPPLFIWEIFKNEAFRSELSKLGSGTSGSMKNISKQKLRKVLLIQPPMNLQKEFAEVSEKLHSMITSANVAKLKQDRLFHSLQQRAFNGTL